MNHTIVVQDHVQTQEQQAPKPKPQCCEGAKTGPVWWETRESHQTLPFPVKPGWTAVLDCSIPARTYWLYNPAFCPLCGTKLPDQP